MKKLYVFLLIFLPLSASAQRLVYDVHFEYLFDNREFDVGGNLFTNSMTIHAARLTPEIGLELRQEPNVTHRIMAGWDFLKNMGGDAASDFHFYYGVQARTSETEFSGYAGVLPRSLAKGKYSSEFLSDSLRFYDNKLDGLLLQLRRPHSFFELGMDWMGQYGQTRRERFTVFSYGETHLRSWLSAGWALAAHHYAGTMEYGGVVDNILAEPFVTFELNEYVPLDKLSLTLKWLQGLQQDRRLDAGVDFPAGGQVEVAAGKYGFGIENRTFIGTGMMPYYNDYDDGGFKYGNDLYWASPFYRIHHSEEVSRGDIGMYDRLEVYWQPRISDWLQLKLSGIFHFTSDSQGLIYNGWQQRLSLVADIGGSSRHNK